MRYLVIIIFTLISFVNGIGQTNNIDSIDSYISFEVSNMAINTVEGKIYGMWGSVEFNVADLSSAKMVAQIDPNSVTTGNDTRDKHLEGPDYFSSAVYTAIKFESKSIVAEGGHYLANGILTMKGTSKNVEIEFNESEHKGKRALEGTLVLDRYDYSIGSKGGFSIGREVSIKIFCVLKPS